MGRAAALFVCRFARRLADARGQATVEAAFLVPVLLGGVLLLVQPGIILYDRIVMQAAAVEGCRLLATAPSAETGDMAEDYVRRRLGAVPPLEVFHVHEGGCTWDISLSGSETSGEVSVTIATEVRALPLIDFAARAFGLADGDGNLRVEVSATMPTRAAWAVDAAPGSPAEWPGAWAK